MAKDSMWFEEIIPETRDIYLAGKRGIILGYARERKGYRIYDIKSRKIIEERSVKFNESLKGSTYFGKTKAETWDINLLLETSPTACKINQKIISEISSLEILDESAKDENSDSSILYHSRTSRQTDAALGNENETPDIESSSNNLVNRIPVRHSERLKSKQMSVNVVYNIPNTYLEAKNSADWKNWKEQWKMNWIR
ncbi:hypothetical protein HNY73_010872 [Argiope bruennichi]|uniref:Retroviral polymerase SH3-like domain-containing protein n=1 Tax=Argiope bruennichi TaxID=94029 RepID=A0A8T0F2D6_ARGBR|nr:hypothetical protein HNY73_010872 [Argiope bruennichi]